MHRAGLATLLGLDGVLAELFLHHGCAGLDKFG